MICVCCSVIFFNDQGRRRMVAFKMQSKYRKKTEKILQNYKHGTPSSLLFLAEMTIQNGNAVVALPGRRFRLTSVGQ